MVIFLPRYKTFIVTRYIPGTTSEEKSTFIYALDAAQKEVQRTEPFISQILLPWWIYNLFYFCTTCSSFYLGQDLHTSSRNNFHPLKVQFSPIFGRNDLLIQTVVTAAVFIRTPDSWIRFWKIIFKNLFRLVQLSAQELFNPYSTSSARSFQLNSTALSGMKIYNPPSHTVNRSK